jgi:hypothetical protein
MIVAKLRGARDRQRAKHGKCEGRKSYAEARPEMVALARQIASSPPRKSLRQISAELALRGHITANGQPFSASAIKSMLSSSTGAKLTS